MVEQGKGEIVPAAGTFGVPANAFAAAAVAARAYAGEALAPATLRAYAADWRHFSAWCAEFGCALLPASPTADLGMLAQAEPRRVGLNLVRGWWRPTIEVLREGRRRAASLERAQATRRAKAS